MQPPRICDYQVARYILAIQDITVPNLPSMLVRGSFYLGSDSGGSEYIEEYIISRLQINRNYTLFITVVDIDFNEEVSTTLNFSTSIMIKFIPPPPSFLCVTLKDSILVTHTHTHYMHAHNTTI